MRHSGFLVVQNLYSHTQFSLEPFFTGYKVLLEQTEYKTIGFLKVRFFSAYIVSVLVKFSYRNVLTI